MGVSIAFLASGSEEQKIIDHFWSPLMYKQKDRSDIEFLVLSDTITVPKLPYVKKIQGHGGSHLLDAVKQAKHKNVFITQCYGIPTYRNMIALENFPKGYSKNSVLCPVWNHDNSVPCWGAHTVQRDLWKGEDKDEYIKKNGLVEIEETTLYDARLFL